MGSDSRYFQELQLNPMEISLPNLHNRQKELNQPEEMKFLVWRPSRINPKLAAFMNQFPPTFL